MERSEYSAKSRNCTSNIGGQVSSNKKRSGEINRYRKRSGTQKDISERYNTVLDRNWSRTTQSQSAAKRLNGKRTGSRLDVNMSSAERDRHEYDFEVMQGDAKTEVAKQKALSCGHEVVISVWGAVRHSQ